MTIMCFKNYFKPSPVFIVSSQGVEFPNALGRPVKLFWKQIFNIFYEKDKLGSPISVPVDILVFEIAEGNKYKFNLSYIGTEDQKILLSIFKEHNLKIINWPNDR